MATGDRETFVLHLVALPGQPGDAPAHVRLKLILKRLLRQYGFRCTHGHIEKARAASQALGEGEKADQESSAGQNGLAGR